MYIDNYNQNQNDSKYDFDLNKYKQENGIEGDVEIRYDTKGDLLDKFKNNNTNNNNNAKTNNKPITNSNTSTNNKQNTPANNNNNNNNNNNKKIVQPQQANPINGNNKGIVQQQANPNNGNNKGIAQQQAQSQPNSAVNTNSINDSNVTGNDISKSTDNLISNSNNNKVNGFVGSSKVTNGNGIQPDNGKLSIEKVNNGSKQTSFNTLLLPIAGIISLFVVGAAIFMYKKRSNGRKSSNSETCSNFNYPIDSSSENEKSFSTNNTLGDKSSQGESYTDLIKKDRSNLTLSYYQRDSYPNNENNKTLTRNGNTSLDYSDSFEYQNNSFHSDNYLAPEPSYLHNNHHIPSYYTSHHN